MSDGYLWTVLFIAYGECRLSAYSCRTTTPESAEEACKDASPLCVIVWTAAGDADSAFESFMRDDRVAALAS